MTDRQVSTASAAGVLALAALSIAASAPVYLNHDAAWYLYMVQRWFHGATLYRDIVDTNPPLIVWLTAIPGGVSALGGVPATAAFKLFVYAIAAGSLSLVATTVRRNWVEHQFVLLLAVTFACLPFVKGDFGQREHLALLLTLPYMFEAAAARPASAAIRLLIGVAAGLGFAIKPHFLMALVAIEIAVATHRGRAGLRRREAIAAAATIVVYALVLVLATPAYLTVARQVQQVYGGLNSAFGVLIRLRELQVWLAVLALIAAVRWPDRDALVNVLFAGATGFLAAALLQFKGWSYHLYPARALLVLTLAAAGTALVRLAPALVHLLRGGRRGLAGVFAAALAIASARYVAEARNPTAPDLVTPLIGILSRDAQHGPAVVLGMRTLIYPQFPAVNYAHAWWGLRHNSLWFLQGFYDEQDLHAGGPFDAHPLDRMIPLERMFFDQVVDDLCASPPAVLAVERALPSAPAGRRALDLLAYYGQSPRAARLLHAYSPTASLGPFTLFEPTGSPACE